MNYHAQLHNLESQSELNRLRFEVQPWTTTPQAAALLGSCARTPPSVDIIRRAGLVHTAMAAVYSRDDKRVRALDDIRDAYGEREWKAALADIEGCGGREAVWALFPETDEAIAQAIEGRAEQEQAA